MRTADRAILFQQIDRLYKEGTAASQDDTQLLARYVRDGDGAAFEALIRRHGPLVLSLCGRILRDSRDIEDAFQATFLILARRADSIRNRAGISSWLYGVAFRVATRCRSEVMRRRTVETPLETLEFPARAEQRPMDELGPDLDQELNRLPEKYRAPLVLCYLREQTHDQAAAELNWPVGTVRSRLARGRELLRGRLTRRGWSAANVAMSLAPGFGLDRFARQVPQPLIDATVASAGRFLGWSTAAAAPVAVHLSSGLSGTVPSLAQGVLSTMAMTQFAWIGSGVATLALVAGGMGAGSWALAALDEKPAAAIAKIEEKTVANPVQSPAPGLPSPAPSRGISPEVDARLTELERKLDRLISLQSQARPMPEPRVPAPDSPREVRDNAPRPPSPQPLQPRRPLSPDDPPLAEVHADGDAPATPVANEASPSSLDPVAGDLPALAPGTVATRPRAVPNQPAPASDGDLPVLAPDAAFGTPLDEPSPSSPVAQGSIPRRQPARRAPEPVSEAEPAPSPEPEMALPEVPRIEPSPPRSRPRLAQRQPEVPLVEHSSRGNPMGTEDWLEPRSRDSSGSAMLGYNVGRSLLVTVREIEAQIQIARRKQRNKQQLFSRGSISKEEYEASEDELGLLAARLQGLNDEVGAGVEQSEANLSRLTAEIDNAKARVEVATATAARNRRYNDRKPGMVSAEEVARDEGQLTSAKASLQAREAEHRQAKLWLPYLLKCRERIQKTINGLVDISGDDSVFPTTK